jgi:hypothetical protein
MGKIFPVPPALKFVRAPQSTLMILDEKFV